MIPTILSCWLRDLDLADAGDGGALCHAEGQQSGRARSGFGLYRPPDLVSAAGAGGQRRLVPQRAVAAFEPGEDNAALAGWWR
jgi:hypothetical protein